MSGATRWRRPLVSIASPRIAGDPSGDVVVAGGDVVRRLAGGTGGEEWVRSLDGDVAAAVTLDAGRVVLAATGSDQFNAAFFVVRTLDASTGTPGWRRPLGLGNVGGRATAIAIAPDGDVVAAGTQGPEIVVMRFDAATGADVWRTDISGSGSGSTGTNVPTAVAVDTAGDVFVAGSVENATTDVVVVKLAGATGVELWRHTIAGDRLVDSSIFETQSFLALTSTGDAVVAGRRPTGSGSVWFESTTTVARVAGATGVGAWQTTIGDVGAPPSNDQPGDLGLDASGDVYVTSKLMLALPTPTTALAVRALSGVDGSERWRMDLPGHGSASHAEAFVAGTASALDPSGNVVAGGCVVKRQTGEPESEATVLTLVAANGADRVAGTTLTVADRPGQPAARAVKLLAKTGVGLSVSPDADPVLLGGALELRNPGTGESATFALPAAGWTARIGTKGLDYFVYRDSVRQYGPCTNVLIRSGSLKATCKGAQIGFTLDEPSQGALAVRLTTGNGAGARRYCTQFGGTVSQDQPNAFKARAADAPSACPFP